MSVRELATVARELLLPLLKGRRGGIMAFRILQSLLSIFEQLVQLLIRDIFFRHDFWESR